MNFIIFFGFQKISIFGGEDFVDIFWGQLKTGLVLGVISMHFWGLFLRSMYMMRIFFFFFFFLGGGGGVA